MKRLEFDDLVRRLEARFAGRQRALQRNVALWIVLGLVGIVSWLLLLGLLGLVLFVAGAFVQAPFNVILIGAGVALILYALCQAAYILWVEPPPRQGYVLKPGAAPLLDEELSALARTLQCRSFDEVRITMDFNACVTQDPSLGLLGWPRTTLEIGLPLAYAVDTAELRAVLAHEMAHRLGKHGRGPGYVVTQSWIRLFQQMQRPAHGSFERSGRWALAKFLDWYWPRLHARSFALARAYEYYADRHAADIVGASVAASALWRIECLGPWLGDVFWTELWQRTADTPDPPGDVLRQLQEAYRTGPQPVDAALRVERGLSRTTAHEETHPSFVDRVAPLGWNPEDVRRLGFPRAAVHSAAASFLGAALTGVEQALSQQWRNNVLASWRDRHRRARAEAKRQQAGTKPDDSPAAVDAAADVQLLWESARDTVNRVGLGAAAPLLRQVLERDPAHGGAAVLLGQHLAALGDPEGERLLENVIVREDELWLPRACEALERHHRDHGRVDDVRALRARLDRHEADMQAAQRERSSITARDRFLAHQLSDDRLDALQTLLAEAPEVSGAWLARKELKYFPQRQLFVLCVRCGRSRWWPFGADDEQALVRRLAAKVQLPGQVFVIGRHGSFRALARKIVNLPGAQILPRSATAEPTAAATHDDRAE
jgi:Zn-dependent protease with chaperone function